MEQIDVREVRDKLVELEKRVVKNEANSRGRNLRIDGLPFNKDVPLEDMIRKAIKEGCGMSEDFMKHLLIDTCHRVGKKEPNRERTVIVAFCQRGHLEQIMRKRGNLARYKFDGTHVLSFNPDGTKEMVSKKKEAMQIRKKLLEKLKMERKTTKVQIRGWEKIKVGDDAPLHYTEIAKKYNL